MYKSLSIFINTQQLITMSIRCVAGFTKELCQSDNNDVKDGCGGSGWGKETDCNNQTQKTTKLENIKTNKDSCEASGQSEEIKFNRCHLSTNQIELDINYRERVWVEEKTSWS